MTTVVEDAKQTDQKSDIPGGQFTAKQNDDGTWSVYDVPIFVEHKVNMGREEDEAKHVGEVWMKAAKAKEDSRVANDSYLPPLHIHHHGMGDTTRAGFFRSKSVAQAKYQGKLLWMTFADLVKVPAEVYAKVKAGELPYRSVEIHNLDKPEINSLALLDDEVPFFRLSLLTIGKEIPAEGLRVGETLRAMDPKSTPVLAYRALGDNGSNVLMNLDGKLLRRQDMADEEKDEKKKDEKLALDDEGQAKLAEALNAAISQLQAAVKMLTPEGDEDAPSDDAAPAPAENLSAEGDEAGKGSEAGKGAKDFAAEIADLPEAARAPVAKLLGRVDAAEERVGRMEHDRETEKAVLAATKELVTYGLDQEKTAKTLFSIAKKAGIPAMQSYAQGVKDNGQADPASDIEGGDTAANLPKELQVFANQGEGILEKAMTYSKEFDEAKKHGLKMDFGRQRYVADCLAVAGHKVEIPEKGKED